MALVSWTLQAIDDINNIAAFIAKDLTVYHSKRLLTKKKIRKLKK